MPSSEISVIPPTVPRYDRPREEAPPVPIGEIVPFDRSNSAIADSPLSDGSRALLRGLLQLGTVRVFPGGGLGIEYGSLLKTAARPEFVAEHVHEAARHLREQRVDLLLVPGMSGYPIGSMYALAAGIPALLLKKTLLRDADPQAYPAGAFVIPSYTGDGDVVMHADPVAAMDIVSAIFARQVNAQAHLGALDIDLRVGGADDIIDKSTMSQAVGESALQIGESALRAAIAAHRVQSGETRPISTRVSVVAWVTPLIKSYNRGYEHLQRAFGLHPFAGLDIAAISLHPPAIDVAGIGAIAFAGATENRP